MNSAMSNPRHNHFVYYDKGVRPTVTSSQQAEQLKDKLQPKGDYAYYLASVNLEGAALFEALERVKAADDSIFQLTVEMVRACDRPNRIITAKPIESTAREWIESWCRNAFGLSTKEVDERWLTAVYIGVCERNEFLSPIGEKLYRTVGEYTIIIDGVEYIIPDMWRM